jgi:hypothetical protein
VHKRNCDPQLRRGDVGVAAALGIATAIVVVVQNARLTVLWDLSYILENATRIAMGDLPYRDFPFPYAPLTFVLQALIIRLFGRAPWHHVAFAAMAGGAATALTYTIVRRVAGRIRATILTLPLIALGIYCIFPHPFYDPDCCLVILAVVGGYQLSVVGSQLSDNRPPTTDNRFFVGLAAVLPLFIKQNIGLAFLAAFIVLALMAREWRLLGGIASGLAIAVALVAAIFGTGNYIQWTVRFAAARRLPPIGEVLSIYIDPTLMWWLALLVAGALVMRRYRAVGVAVATIPFLWSIVRIVMADDPLEREINLLRSWPLLLVCGTIAAIADRELVPLLLIAAVHGAFLSQSTWGSTYGIWPLVIIIAAYAMRRAPIALPIAFTLALLAGGIPYVVKSERLTYAKLDFDWRSGFEELVRWSEAHIPRQDAIVCIPGEDLFYFTTGRRPRFPVLMFDRTINPYDARTIAALARERNVRWVIVKERLQINGTPMENRDETLRLLTEGGHIVARLRNYIVWQTGVHPPTGGGTPSAADKTTGLPLS